MDLDEKLAGKGEREVWAISSKLWGVVKTSSGIFTNKKWNECP
jgi:hypothetical protein